MTGKLLRLEHVKNGNVNANANINANENANANANANENEKGGQYKIPLPIFNGEKVNIADFEIYDQRATILRDR